MNVQYYLTILPPKLPGCEAIGQQIAALMEELGGELVYLNPNDRSPIYVPRLGFGFHRLRQIRARENRTQIHHVFNPDPFAFPVLRWLRQPIVYTLTATVERKIRNVGFFASLDAITVADHRSLERLQRWGLKNVTLIRSGVDTRRFTQTPLPVDREIHLLVGSAPWNPSQFRTKGVDALLQAAQQSPNLRLTFLWRGILAKEMEQRVQQAGLQSRVRVLNQRVDVNEVLATVHASIALASDPAVLHPYPHSLVESLAAGKPVLVSRSIPMADDVKEQKYGAIIEQVSAQAILSAVERLKHRYHATSQAARQADLSAFDQRRLVQEYCSLYESIPSNASARVT